MLKKQIIQNFRNLPSGDAGSGKSSAMAKLVLDWAAQENCEEPKEEKPRTETGLERFEYTFLIELKDVDSDIPLEEIIIKQHELEVKQCHIKFILQNENPLILLDGYDEYNKSTNSDIDAIVSGKRGNSFIIITCRPEEYMDKQDRNKLDAEIQIRGLSDQRVHECAERYLNSKEKSQTLIDKANHAEIYELLKIPIVLLMMCVLYLQTEALPKTRTDIVWEIIQLYKERAAEKGHEIVDEMLYVLGELSWLALQKDTHQLFIMKVSLNIKYRLMKPTSPGQIPLVRQFRIFMQRTKLFIIINKLYLNTMKSKGITIA